MALIMVCNLMCLNVKSFQGEKNVDYPKEVYFPHLQKRRQDKIVDIVCGSSHSMGTNLKNNYSILSSFSSDCVRSRLCLGPWQ